MAAVSIRNLDERVKVRLRLRAARNGRSMEAEMRAILTEAVTEPGDADGLFNAMAAVFGELGGVDLEIPGRTTRRRAANEDVIDRIDRRRGGRVGLSQTAEDLRPGPD